MRNLVFTLCLCLVSIAYAGNNKQGLNDDTSLGKLESKIKEVVVKPFDVETDHFNSKEGSNNFQAESPEASLFSKKILNEKELVLMRRAAQTLQLDSVVSTINSSGIKTTRQYFMFDENRRPIKRLNSYWNSTTETWNEPAEIYEYVWDEDGYCLSQLAYNSYSGQRYDYEYNDKKQGIAMISYLLTAGEWVPIQRGEYAYDEYGNVVEETIFSYGGPSLWLKEKRGLVAYDERGNQLKFEPYKWSGEEWIGSDDKKTYEWDINNNMILNDCYLWVSDSKTWFHYFKMEQDFKDANPKLCTRQERMYYNKELDNWSGVETYFDAVLYNKKSIYLYDELDRITYEDAQKGTTTDGYVKGADIVHVWSDLEDGVSKRETTETTYPADAESYATQIAVRHYNDHGNEIYSYIKQINISTKALLNYSEREVKFDENQNEIERIEYKFDRTDNSKRLGTSKQWTVFNEFNLPTEFTSQRGQNTSDTDWVNSTYFTYTYEQDTILVERKAHRWGGESFGPNWGDGFIYNYDIPLNEVVMWPGANTYHTIVETRNYELNYETGDWDYISNIYHYSEYPAEVLPIENLSAVQEDENINLTWDSPANSDKVEYVYNIYLDGELLEGDVTKTEYSFTPEEDGTYEFCVAAKAADGREAEKVCKSVVYTGGSDIAIIEDSQIEVYPKYVDDQLNIVAKGDVNVNLYSIQGVLVLTTTDKIINVSNLSHGVYIVEVNNYTTKIVKK